MKVEGCIVGPGHGPKGPRWTECHTVDGFIVARNFSNRGESVGQKGMTRPLLSSPNGDNPFALKVPGQIIHAPGKDAGLGLDEVFCLCRIPNLDVSLDVYF